MPRTPLALDKMVDFLAGEDQYWQKMLHDRHLWDAKEKETASARTRHVNKRRRLCHYRDRSNNNSSKEDDVKRPTTTESPIFDLTKDEEGDDEERFDFEHAFGYISERTNDSDSEDIVNLVPNDPPSVVQAITSNRPTQKQNPVHSMTPHQFWEGNNTAYHAQAPAINDANYKQTCPSCQRISKSTKTAHCACASAVVSNLLRIARRTSIRR
jgi:hypothetical protein